MEYVENNYCDSTFSVNKMSDEFRITVPYLCYVYKEYTRNTITNHLWELRLEKSKELLLNSDMKVKDIIYSVGYLDSSNFIRKFKNSVGVTPGQYGNTKQYDK